MADITQYFWKYKLSILWTLTLLTLTFIPKQDVPDFRYTFKHIDKVVHFTFYFILIILFLFESNDSKGYRLAVIGFLCCILLGISTEYGQYYMKLGRSFEWTDMVANMLGCISGLVLFKVLLNERLRKK